MRAAVAVAALVALVALPLILSSPPATAPEPGAYFTAEEIARADRYSSLRLPIALGATALTLAVTILLAIGPAARILGAAVERLTGGRWILTASILAAVVSIVPTLIVLPLSVLRHRIDRDFGLATNTTGQMLLDVVRAAGVGLLLAVVAAVGFVALARAVPRAWPLVTAVAASVMLVGLVLLFPLVYEPIFNDFESVEEPTRSRILALADDVGVPVRDVLVADASRRTSRHNAYVSGIGATRRVVLYDTLLNGAPPEEVDLVVAHELAHVKHGDVRNGTLMGIAGVVAGIAVLAFLVRSPTVAALTGASGARDPRIVPFVAAFVAVAGLVTLPLQSLVSRSVEARADRFAIARTGSVDVAISLEQRLARTNLADLTPNRLVHLWFGTHPTTMERIGIALEASSTR